MILSELKLSKFMEVIKVIEVCQSFLNTQNKSNVDLSGLLGKPLLQAAHNF